MKLFCLIKYIVKGNPSFAISTCTMGLIQIYRHLLLITFISLTSPALVFCFGPYMIYASNKYLVKVTSNFFTNKNAIQW